MTPPLDDGGNACSGLRGGHRIHNKPAQNTTEITSPYISWIIYMVHAGTCASVSGVKIIITDNRVTVRVKRDNMAAVITLHK